MSNATLDHGPGIVVTETAPIGRCPYFHETRLGSLTLLALRVVIGLAFVLHGEGKMAHATTWMGEGAPSWLQFLAAASEYYGGMMLAAGLFTPIAALGITGTMIGALTMVHLPAGHPFVAKGEGHTYELALVYLAFAVHALVNGPGCLSLDYALAKLWMKQKSTV